MFKFLSSVDLSTYPYYLSLLHVCSLLHLPFIHSVTGSTEEYGAVVSETLRLFPNTRLIAIGMSLGGGLVCKYLGENLEKQKNFIACISLCQGYDYLR